LRLSVPKGDTSVPISNVNGVNINYRIVGAHGPWVALIPGGRRGHVEFVPLAEKVAAHGYRVLLHDRRNTGASDLQFDVDNVEEATWAEDLHALMEQLGVLPAFIGGSSSGARTAILFALRYPRAVRGLLLLRITGGPFAAGRLPENYYDQYIRAAETGGMAAVCATEHYAKLIETNPANRDKLMAMEPQQFIAVLKRWRDKFVAGAHLPVMGVTEAELASIKAPTIVIPGNDMTHSSESGRIAHRLIRGSALHQLPIVDQQVPLILFEEWTPYESEIAQALADFMANARGERAGRPA
jgi:pimeloyl-ACP methyl ester carboxylesterase